MYSLKPQPSQISDALNIYRWQGTNLQGKKIGGDLQAVSRDAARLQLQQQGILVVKMKKKRNYAMAPLQKKISLGEKATFFRQLATLMAANVPLAESLALLLKNQLSPSLLTICIALKKDIESGKTLALGLKKSPKSFDPLTCQLIHIGEQSGTLVSLLERIASMQEKMVYFRKKLQQALLYPCLVLCTALGLLLLMLVWIVPRFVMLFQNSALPPMTRWVVGLSNWARQDGGLFFLCGVIVGCISYYYFGKNKLCRALLQNFLLKLPWLGSLIKKLNLSRFSYLLAITLSAGMPLLEALKIIAGPIKQSVYDQAIANLVPEINNGRPLYHALRQSPLFSTFLINMVKIGEETGRLEALLNTVATTYEAEIEHFLINAGQLLEPLIMIVLGVLIGGLVIAMYLPIFKLGAMA